MGSNKSKEFKKLPLLPIADKFLKKVQPKLADEHIHIESLKAFEKRKGKGFDTIPGERFSILYTYIVLEDGTVRYAALSQDKNIPKVAGKIGWGHTSLLPQELYDAAYNEHSAVVKYAGLFHVNSEGVLTRWSNDSGHFMPFKAHHVGVSKALSIPKKTFYHPRNSRAYQAMLNMLREEESGDEFYGANAINYENEFGENEDNMNSFLTAHDLNNYGSHGNGYYTAEHNQLGHANGYNNVHGYDAGNGMVLVAVMMIFMLFC
eukprot:77122_1